MALAGNKHLNGPADALPAEAEVELGVLLQFLHHTDGFALALAEVNAKPFEAELIAEAAQRFDRIAVIDLASLEHGPGLGSRLIEAADGADAVFLIGFDDLVAPGASQQPVLAQLDLARNRLESELAAPLVLWAPAYVIAELPFRAPNLWSLAVDRFVFAADGGRALNGARSARVGFARTDADYRRERSRLEELLADVGPGGRADVRAELLGRLGDVARMQSRYEDADGLLREALVLYLTLGARLGEANTLMSIGRLAVAKGDGAEARDALSMSSSLYRSIGMDHWSTIAQQEIQRLDASSASA